MVLSPVQSTRHVWWMCDQRHTLWFLSLVVTSPRAPLCLQTLLTADDSLVCLEKDFSSELLDGIVIISCCYSSLCGLGNGYFRTC